MKLDERPIADLIAWLESPRVEGDRLNDKSVLWHVIQQTLPHHKGSYKLAEELPHDIRRALEGALRRGDELSYHSDQWLRLYGLPDKGTLPRYLGVEPAGPLETILPGPRRWPAWKWLKAAVLAEIPREEAILAISSAFEPAARAALLREPFHSSYDFQGIAPTSHYLSLERDDALFAVQTLMVELLSTCGADVIEAEAASALPKTADLPSPPFVHPLVLLVALGRNAKSQGRVLDERWLRLFQSAFSNGSRALYREALEAVPIAHREKILLNRVFGPWTTVHVDAKREEVHRLTLSGASDSLADLCPTRAVLRALVAAVVEHWPEYPEAEGLEIAAKVGPALALPLAEALEAPDAQDFEGRRFLVEMMSATGAPEAEPYVKELASSRKTNDRKAAARCMAALEKRDVPVVLEKKKRAQAAKTPRD